MGKETKSKKYFYGGHKYTQIAADKDTLMLSSRIIVVKHIA